MSAVKDMFARFGAQGSSSKVEPPPKPPMSASPPRFLIIGAGSRGSNYSEAIDMSSNGVVAAVAEPVKYKREALGKKHIWGDGEPKEGQSFRDWREFLDYENTRRKRVADGEKNVPDGVDGVFVCVLDEMHREVVVGLAPLGLNIMCEKPLACSLEDCIAIYKALLPHSSSKVFSIGHVLRYSPHNIMLRKLLIEDRIIGDINSVIHTEPVGWWHFTHSYVRGNWRRSDTTGPSLLTKSCHDIDLLLWLLCSPEKAGQGEPHLPASITSTGALQYFKKSRKPAAAMSATNCLKCPLGDEGCKYSAKNVYLGPRFKGAGSGNTRWPLSIVVHDIEEIPTIEARQAALTKVLEDDYAESTPDSEKASRNWYGRCVFESDNDVCDDQFVTITWPETAAGPPKRATFHMVAQTTEICERYSNLYGDKGEMYADSKRIVVRDFASGESRTFHPRVEDLGHGGGDIGLARQYVFACDKIKNHGWEAERAQNEYVGCTLEEVIRSHALVFAAEEARVQNKVLDWQEFWDREVASKLDK
jgi:predicted dehydrogenase